MKKIEYIKGISIVSFVINFKIASMNRYLIPEQLEQYYVVFTYITVLVCCSELFNIHQYYCIVQSNFLLSLLFNNSDW